MKNTDKRKLLEHFYEKLRVDTKIPKDIDGKQYKDLDKKLDEYIKSLKNNLMEENNLIKEKFRLDHDCRMSLMDIEDDDIDEEDSQKINREE